MEIKTISYKDKGLLNEYTVARRDGKAALAHADEIQEHLSKFVEDIRNRYGS